MLLVELEKTAQLRTLRAMQLVASSRSLRELIIADELGSSSNEITKPSGILRARAGAAVGIKRARSLVATRGLEEEIVCIYREPN